MTIKKVFKVISILWLFVTNAFCQTKPNVLWLVIEDTSPQFIGCYGNQSAKTPNIDLLAKQGVRFTNAFSTGTVCSPSRSTIITGVRTFELGTGNHRSKFPIPQFIKGFPAYLRQAGYYTSNNKKSDYNTIDQNRIIEEAWNEHSENAGWWNREKGQPFFSIFKFDDSHQSRTMTNPYDLYIKQVLNELPADKQIADTDFIPPPIFRNTAQMRHQLARIYNGVSLADYKLGRIIDRLKADNLLDSTIIFFYADHGQGMPGAKTNGIDLGFRVPFIIRFPEAYKHLSPFGTAGIVTDELISFADLAPTLLKMAGVTVPTYMHGRDFLAKESSPKKILLSSDGSEGAVNLFRTFTTGNLTYSRAFMPFMPQMFYQKYFDFSEVLKQMRKDFKNNLLSQIQTKLFKTGTAEYLYDIKQDPWQTNNLANKAEYKKLIHQLRLDMRDSVIKNRDIMFLPAYELQQISKSITPYEYRLSNGNYPIEDIYTAASLSGNRSKTALEQKMLLLQHSNKIVRYWAALALKCNTSQQLAKYKSELLDLMNDENYLHSKIVLASICYDSFSDVAAKEILINTLKSEEVPLIKQFVLQLLLYQKSNRGFVAAVNNLLEDKSIDATLRENAELFVYITTGKPLNYSSFW